MKKLSLFIALTSSSLLGYSQNNNEKNVPPEPIERSKFSIGVIGGFGDSFLLPYVNAQFRPSWNVGISAIYAPKQHFGIGIDALYSVEGAKFLYHNPYNQTDYTSQTELDYIRIPVKAIFFFRGYEKDFRPKVALGPTLGILVNETNSVNAASVDLGANLSLGFNYRIAKAVWINVDASYYQGFLDVYSNNSENDLNGNVRLNAGINLGF